MTEPGWLQEQRKESLRDFEGSELKYFKYGLSLNLQLKGLEFSGEGDVEVSAEGTGADVMPLHEAMQDERYSGIVEKYLMKRAFYPKENKITAFHAGRWKRGTLVVIPEDSEAKVTINTMLSEGSSASHVLVMAGRNSRAKIAEYITSEDGNVLTTAVEAFLEEGAEVHYETLQDLGGVWHFGVNRAVISDNASMDWFTACTGGRTSRMEISTDLAGKGSRTSNMGLFFGKGEQQFDIYNTAIHTQGNTYSNMDNKGIVTDRAKSIFRGLIHIKEKARNSNGYQKQDTLILSDEAEADAVPNLEIYNNDVACSHGATIGQVDDEKIFYMMSRGLSREEAEREIIKGFLDAMVSKAADEDFRKEVERALGRKML